VEPTGSAGPLLTDARPADHVLLDVRGLTTEIAYRNRVIRAVQDVSFTIQAGETACLVGESGSGKSMTGLSIMRLLPHRGGIVSGSVRLRGTDLTQLPLQQMRRVRGAQVAIIFQDPMSSLNPTMTIGRQLAEPLEEHNGMSRKAALARAAELLDGVGIPRPAERLASYPHQLSGGQRQRVAIAMATACGPKLLIADEPTTALDVTIQHQILSLLQEMKERLAMGLLLVTHDMGVVAGWADRVMVMYAGRLVETAPTGRLSAGMRHPYSRALLQAVPTLRTDRTAALRTIPGSPPDLAVAGRGCSFAPRCEQARDACREQSPPLTAASDGTYACFFPVSAVAADKPAVTPAAVTDPVGQDLQDRGGQPAPLLSLRQVVREYPVRQGLPRWRGSAASVKAVSQVTLDVYDGETFAIVGESGCGKSTLGRLMTGAERPDGGQVDFDGVDITRLTSGQRRSHARRAQLMFQDPYASLDPRMRIVTSLREPFVAQRLGSRSEQEQFVRSLLLDTGLSPDIGSRYPYELSGGQRQRVGLGRALALRPRLVVADEPVSALDVSVQAQVLNLMRRLQREHGLTYVFISHDLAVVRYIADRVGVMYLGRIVELGPADEVYRSPAHPYTAGLLSSASSAEPGAAGSGSHTPGADAPVRGELPSPVDPPSGCRFHTRCGFAQPLCAEQTPVMRAFGSSRHTAACHFPLIPSSEVRAPTKRPADA